MSRPIQIMPDAAHDATPPPDWARALVPGDVLLARLPVPGGGSTLEPRPCLLVEVEHLGGERLLRLAHGVPAVGRPRRGLDVHASEEDLRGVRGLRRGYVFHTARPLLLVPVRHSCLIPAEGGSPVLGRLGGEARERLDAVRGRLAAERDVAADRRRRHRRRRPAVRGRDFTVELHGASRRRPPARRDGEGL